ncbi:MAG: dihydrodipicolinate synthase family protein [Planctomycetes bacterium]|nr:dihydrodipicolinate synthase family protein [Planctomycetota bacterium]MCC7064597.1 dihydrodipicolinate synthase family protein [Planctomycetota bacterium]
MSASPFRHVLPAITTPLRADDTVDHDFLARHARWQLDQGCSGIIPLGSLGEGATLDFEEKKAILATLVKAAGDKPVMPGIAALSTRQAVALAQEAERLGCRGLMVLPPYVHKGELREMTGHVSAVLRATKLPCMLYNNPPAYGTDFTPPCIEQLAAQHENLVAVKESSGDARRVTAIKALVGDRLAVLVGMDDMCVEGVAAGATGWVAGLVNAFPRESVQVFELALAGRMAEATELYRWFLPLLRLDTVPEFVQLIKLVQQEVGQGTERVRLPRTPVTGALREHAMAVIKTALAKRPGAGK